MQRTKAVLWGSRKRRVVAVILSLLLITSTAFAAWSVIRATGNGSGKVGTLAAPTISNVAAPTGDIFPNETTATGSIQLSITNPVANGPMVLKSFGVSDSATTGGDASCDWSIHTAGGFEKLYLYVGPNAAALGPAGVGVYNWAGSLAVPTGTSTVTVPGIVGLMNSTPTACQGTSINNFSISNALFETAP